MVGVWTEEAICEYLVKLVAVTYNQAISLLGIYLWQTLFHSKYSLPSLTRGFTYCPIDTKLKHVSRSVKSLSTWSTIPFPIVPRNVSEAASDPE